VGWARALLLGDRPVTCAACCSPRTSLPTVGSRCSTSGSTRHLTGTYRTGWRGWTTWARPPTRCCWAGRPSRTSAATGHSTRTSRVARVPFRRGAASICRDQRLSSRGTHDRCRIRIRVPFRTRVARHSAACALGRAVDSAFAGVVRRPESRRRSLCDLFPRRPSDRRLGAPDRGTRQPGQLLVVEPRRGLRASSGDDGTRIHV